MSPTIALRRLFGPQRIMFQRPYVLILVAFLANMPVGTAFAARGLPPPLLECFEKGYGVVAATSIEATPAEQQYCFNVRFKIESLVAQVVTGQPLPVASGDEITVLIQVGYAGHIETFDGKPPAIELGMKCLLILKYDSVQKRYEQVYGASSVRRLEEFDAATLQRCRLIHNLAATPVVQRPAAARVMFAVAVADLEVRMTVRQVLRTSAQGAQPDDRAATLRFLRQQWLDATLDQGFDRVQTGYVDLCDLDATLQALDPAFIKTSDLRIDRWLQFIFSPWLTARFDDVQASQYAADRWGVHMHQLMTLGLESPEKVSARAIREMNDSSWPLQFRVGIAKALQGMYQSADTANDAWSTVLQRFYPEAFAQADPWVLRLLPSMITYGEREPQYHIKRKFIAGAATWEAIDAAHARMHAAANGDPRIPEAFIAERVLREAIDTRSK